MRSWKSVLLVLLAVTLMMPLSAGAEKVLKVGMLGPFTGPAAQSGNNIKNSLLMKLEEAGMKVGDYKLDIVFIDSQSDPAKAANAYVEAVERKGIQVGLGGWHSSVAIACVDIAAKYGISHMGSMGAAYPLTEKILSDPKYQGMWFKFWGYPALATQLYYEFIQHAIDEGQFEPGKKIVGLSAEETDWGRDWLATAKEMLPKYGWEIFSEDYVQMGQTDFYPLLTRYKKDKVPLIITTNTAAASVSAYIKQIKEIGLKAMPIVDGLGWVGEWYELTGRSSNGVIDMNAMFSPLSEDYRKNFIEKYGFKPTPSAGGISYDCAGMFLKMLNRTLEKHGELNKDTIHEVMDSEMRTGQLTYGKADGAVIMNEYKFTAEMYPDPVTDAAHWFMPVIQYKDGKGYIVYPLSHKEKDFEF